MKRTQKQINNIKNGCKHRDNTSIINAQKKRHLTAKINKLIIEKLKEEKNIESCTQWASKLETITTNELLKELLKEIKGSCEINGT